MRWSVSWRVIHLLLCFRRRPVLIHNSLCWEFLVPWSVTVIQFFLQTEIIFLQTVLIGSSFTLRSASLNIGLFADSYFVPSSVNCHLVVSFDGLLEGMHLRFSLLQTSASLNIGLFAGSYSCLGLLTVTQFFLSAAYWNACIFPLFCCRHQRVLEQKSV